MVMPLGLLLGCMRTPVYLTGCGTQEHIAIAAALYLPVIVIVTKIDMAPPDICTKVCVRACVRVLLRPRCLPLCRGCGSSREVVFA
jgi:hypothetical protein